MIFNKNTVAAVALLLSVTLEVSAHAAIVPMLGVKGKPVRNDVQRPSSSKPCGSIDIAKELDTSTALTMSSSKTFKTTITNFNSGVDGSREVTTAEVDATGTGKKFVAAKVTKNGTKAPTNVGSEDLEVELPAACTGGKSKNKCLVSLKTAGGFGNCVVVQNPAAKREDGAIGSRAARAARMSEIEELD